MFSKKNYSRWFLFALLLISPFVLAGNKIAPAVQTNPDQVMRTALSGLGRSASWMVQVSSAAPAIDAWVAASHPAELDVLVTRQSVINIAVEHCDTVDTAVPVCVRFGPDTNTPALDCSGTITQNGKPLNNLNALFQYQGRQIFDQTLAANSSVPIWVRGSSATVVNVCITATW